MTNITQLHPVPKVSVRLRVRVSVSVMVKIRHRVALAPVLLSGSKSVFHFSVWYRVRVRDSVTLACG